MAESTNEVTLGDAGRNQISVSGVSGLAPSQVWGQGRAIAANPASIWEISGWALLMWTL